MHELYYHISKKDGHKREKNTIYKGDQIKVVPSKKIILQSTELGRNQKGLQG